MNIITYYIFIILIICILVRLLIYILKKNKYIENFNYKNKIDKFLVISLDNYNGRKKWKSIKKTIFGNKLTKFKGINGNNINICNYKNIIKKKWDYGTWKYNKRKIVEMSNGEIGCCLSHFYIWKQISKKKYNITMVLEDDATIYNKQFINLTHNMKKTYHT